MLNKRHISSRKAVTIPSENMASSHGRVDAVPYEGRREGGREGEGQIIGVGRETP